MENSIPVKHMRKYLLYTLIAIFLLAVTYYAYSWVYYYHYATDRKSTDIVFLWQWKLHAEGLRSAYQHDTYGGATPEETLQMFVAALEQKDAWLASRYYIPEKQDVVYKELQVAIRRGTIVSYKNHILSFVDGRTATSSGVYFIYSSESSESKTYALRFAQNPTTEKWKIVSP